MQETTDKLRDLAEMQPNVFDGLLNLVEPKLLGQIKSSLEMVYTGKEEFFDF